MDQTNQTTESPMEGASKKPGSTNYRKWIALVGAFMIFFPEHFINAWGNMTVYITSYFFAHHGITSVDSPWTVTLFIVGKSIGINIPGYLTCVGRKTRIFWSIFMFHVAVGSLYFIVKCGAPNCLFIVFGIIGICCGTIDSGVIKILSEMAGDSKGSYISLVSSAFNFGPFVINLFIGFYMNPLNVSPNVQVDKIVLFGQPELVDKTLSMLLILFISYAVCIFTGFLLLSLSVPSQPPPEPTEEEGEETVYQSFSDETNSLQMTTRQNSRTDERAGGTENTGFNNTENGAVRNYVEDRNDPEVSEINYEGQNLTPLETLKYIPFYIIGFTFGSSLFGYVVMNSWYKTFGLLYIDDDNLLTQLGSFFSLGGGITRIFWGFALDRFSIKNIQVIMCTYLSITILIMYFSAHLNQYFYFVVTLLSNLGTNLVLPTYVMISLSYFGEKYFYKNYGMLYLVRAFYVLIIAPLFQVLRSQFGWFGPFCCSSIVNTVSLILVVFFVPDMVKRKKK